MKKTNNFYLTDYLLGVFGVIIITLFVIVLIQSGRIHNESKETDAVETTDILEVIDAQIYFKATDGKMYKVLLNKGEELKIE